MKKTLLTIFLFTYLFSSVGFTAAIHFCEMKMQVVDDSDMKQCCQNTDDQNSDEEACCVVEKEPTKESTDCCSTPDFKKHEQQNPNNTGIENKCCNDFEYYKTIDNAVKTLSFESKAVQFTGEKIFSSDYRIANKVTTNKIYNPTIDHLNTPLLI